MRITFAAVAACLLSAAPASAAELHMSLATSVGGVVCDATSGLRRCPAPAFGTPIQVTVTWALDAPATLNGYDLNVGWDASELSLVAMEQLYPDDQPVNTIPFLVAPDPLQPLASEAVTLSLVGAATTSLLRLTFQTVSAPAFLLGNCEADVWWTANGNGLSPGSVVLSNPQGAAIDLGGFTMCTDGLDNDNDGAIDFDGGICGGAAVPGSADPQCTSPVATVEAPSSCGLGFEFLAVLLPLRLLRSRRSRA